jgi:hypothetical protein
MTAESRRNFQLRHCIAPWLSGNWIIIGLKVQILKASTDREIDAAFLSLPQPRVLAGRPAPKHELGRCSSVMILGLPIQSDRIHFP